MLLLLSPSKTLNFDASPFKKKSTPKFLAKSETLINVLKTKSVSDIKKLMSVSDKIAELNVGRYQSFKTPFNLKNSKQALFAFTGDVYAGLEAKTFDENDIEFANDHLRILSGLYGALKPLDLMQPYRLEMGTKMKTSAGRDLYQFWGSDVTQQLNKDLKKIKSKVIVNLASNEYYKVIQPRDLSGEVYVANFKENRNGVYKFISFSAKKARGYMAQYIIKNKLTDPEDMKSFDMDNYKFNPKLSNEKEFIFTR